MDSKCEPHIIDTGLLRTDAVMGENGFPAGKSAGFSAEGARDPSWAWTVEALTRSFTAFSGGPTVRQRDSRLWGTFHTALNETKALRS